MAKKRAKFLETRFFGFVLGLIIVGLVLSLDAWTAVFNRLSTHTIDLHFLLKNLNTATAVQEGVTVTAKNPKISDDILIVGIDSRSLAKFGKWPFPRSTHANLIDSFARIKDQAQREQSLFLDVFMIEPDRDASEDARLVRSISQSEKVYMETVYEVGISDYESFPKMLDRQKLLYNEFGQFSRISGPWQDLPPYFGVQAPLQPYGRAMAGYGHANFTQDDDEVYRRQGLIAKMSVELEQIPLDDLNVGYKVDSGAFERLAWVDAKGAYHNIPTPITGAELEKLRKKVTSEAAPVVLDEDGDGEVDKTYFIVRRYKDYFSPAITLALALDYFGVPMKDVDVVLGDYILIPHPTKLDPSTGERVPYSIAIGPATYDKEGNLTQEAPRKTLDEIRIPINDRGEMLVNFMGYRSSSALDGYQTFPVRSYSGYAARVPGPDPQTWPRTKAVGGKILMVGPFADGIAQDEKPTPFGLMYGIEIHANALNTILMNNFINYAPWWLDALILLIAVMLISAASSRLQTGWAFLITIVGVAGFFLTTTLMFDYRSFVIDFPTTGLGMAFAFISIVVYRAMTEEKDKRRIRETFGKYVSPKVVDQILEHPPELGGVDKQLTVLFSDIRGFTTLSENMTPQELVNHLNVYLTSMTDLILEYGGTLDKYVGDEIMCFWGAPIPQEEHAKLACKCALRQMAKLKELNEGWPETKRINIGIGLNSGIMTVGNMGSPGRMNYTLMGDNVNLGARLEGTNKQYGTNIIISEFTYGLVKDSFLVRELDNIRVKGKNKPVVIYELVDCLESLDPPPLEKGAKHRGSAD